MSSVTGQKALLRKMRGLAAEMEAAAEEAHEERAAEILAVANQIVPVDSGSLRDSGKVEKREGGVFLVYTEEYAATVHENPGSTGHKWLERTVDQESSGHVERMAELMRSRVDA